MIHKLVLTIKQRRLFQVRKLFNRARNLYISSILISLLLMSNYAYSQPNMPSLPLVTASSPKAAMMNRYGEYPVSLYTGLVDITIPIFEININGIVVPIEFKYHAS